MKKAKEYNYKCSKCGDTYSKFKKPLPYSDCQTVKSRNPNPVICGGKLIPIKSFFN